MILMLHQCPTYIKIFSIYFSGIYVVSPQCSSVTQSGPTLCGPMDCSMDFLVHHKLPEPTQTHVHWVDDAIQPSHPLLSPSPPAFNHSQHQGLFKWVSSFFFFLLLLFFFICSEFCYTLKWKGLGFTCLPHPDPPSHLPPHPLPPGPPRAPGPSACLLHLQNLSVSE